MTHATHPFDALMDITTRPPAVFVRGEGAWLWDDSGNAISTSCRVGRLIASATLLVAVADALTTQARLLLTPSPAFYNAPSLKLAKALVDRSCFRSGVLCQFRRRSQ